MTVKILLARHGNTFHAGEKAVFAGRRNDLPLTSEGRLQAKEVGLICARSKVIPSRIICGPLSRTTDFANIAAREIAGAPAVTVNPRLDELDYGKWAGLTNDEIISTFGPDELQDWNERAAWPKNANWPEQEDIFIAETLAFVSEIRTAQNPIVLVVTSNGRLRFFPKAVAGGFETLRDTNGLKMKTGNVGVLTFDGSSEVIDFWNQDPKDIATL